MIYYLDLIKSFLSNFNFIDFFIIIAIIAYATEGYSVGFISNVMDLLSFIFSIFVAFKSYKLISRTFMHFNISQILSNLISFIILAVIFEIFFRFILNKVYHFITSENLLNNFYFLKKINQLFGTVTGIISALILIAVVLTALIILPISQTIKNTVTNSFFGKNLISSIQNIDNYLSPSNTNSSLLFLSVNPNQTKPTYLGFTYPNFTENKNDEEMMLKLINIQRKAINLPSLIMDANLTQVAILHGADMLKNGYFSHNDLNGRVFNQRFSDNEIVFEFAGENLAFAPNLRLAMSGLMASPGHKANILSANFKKVGIAALDAGSYGEMFVQDFTN